MGLDAFRKACQKSLMIPERSGFENTQRELLKQFENEEGLHADLQDAYDRQDTRAIGEALEALE